MVIYLLIFLTSAWTASTRRNKVTVICYVLLYSTLLYSTLRYSTLRYSTLLYVLLYSTFYSTLLCSAMLCSTLLYFTFYSALLYFLLCSAPLYSCTYRSTIWLPPVKLVPLLLLCCIVERSYLGQQVLDCRTGYVLRCLMSHLPTVDRRSFIIGVIQG